MENNQSIACYIRAATEHSNVIYLTISLRELAINELS